MTSTDLQWPAGRRQRDDRAFSYPFRLHTEGTGKLLDAVSSITVAQDMEALEVAVATVLFEMVPASRLSIWRIVDHDGYERAVEHVLVRRVRGQIKLQSMGVIAVQLTTQPMLNTAYQTGTTVTSRSALGECEHVFPLTGDPDVRSLAVIVTGSSLGPGELELIAGLIRIARNHMKVINQCNYDALTGLLNRRAFDRCMDYRADHPNVRKCYRTPNIPARKHSDSRFKRLRAGFHRALRAAAPSTPRADSIADEPAFLPDGLICLGRRRALNRQQHAWLGVLDVDYFKRINDSFGHGAGDGVLVQISRLLSRNLRNTDRIFRIGGEEFAIILSPTEENFAEHVFDRLRAAVESYNFQQIGRVTVSLGFTKLRSDDYGCAAFQRADAALYAAKQSGRNAVKRYRSG